MLLNGRVCNDKQKWNETERKCECLKIGNCKKGISWYVSSCRCEYGKKAAKLITTEECEETDNKFNNKTI